MSNKYLSMLTLNNLARSSPCVVSFHFLPLPLSWLSVQPSRASVACAGSVSFLLLLLVVVFLQLDVAFPLVSIASQQHVFSLLPRPAFQQFLFQHGLFPLQPNGQLRVRLHVERLLRRLVLLLRLSRGQPTRVEFELRADDELRGQIGVWCDRSQPGRRIRCLIILKTIVKKRPALLHKYAPQSSSRK